MADKEPHLENAWSANGKSSRGKAKFLRIGRRRHRKGRETAQRLSKFYRGAAPKPSPSLSDYLGLKKTASESPKSPFPRDPSPGWSLADAVAYPGFLHCHPPYDDQKYFGILTCGDWRGALSRIVEDHKAFAKKAPELIEQYQKQLPRYNAEADAFNRQIDGQESELRRKHDVLKNDLKVYINDFLRAHPEIKQYLWFV